MNDQVVDQHAAQAIPDFLRKESVGTAPVEAKPESKPEAATNKVEQTAPVKQ